MNTATKAAITAAATTMCLSTLLAPTASADDSVIHSLGSPAELANGDIVQAWTVKDLKPSTDTIAYPVAGTLWEATATDTAVRGTVQPVVSNLNARARSGQTYRVLFGVATPQGVNPAPLAEGQQTTGKVYFDVTGDAPDSVLYNAGGPDLAVWVQQPSSSPRPTPYDPGSPTRSSSAGGAPAAAAEATPATPAPGAAPAATPASAGTPVVPGSQGTPIAPGSSGTPVAPGSQGTPIPGSAGTPAAGTPTPGAAAGSEPATVAPAATPGSSPAGSSGTPAAGGSAAAGQSALAAPSMTITAPPASEQR